LIISHRGTEITKFIIDPAPFSWAGGMGCCGFDRRSAFRREKGRLVWCGVHRGFYALWVEAAVNQMPNHIILCVLSASVAIYQKANQAEKPQTIYNCPPFLKPDRESAP
jgi:hypothetical protein